MPSTQPLKIVLELPRDFEENKEFDLTAFLNSKIKDIHSAFDLRLDIEDLRADIHQVTVTGASMDETSVWAEYEFEWSVYFGCDNMNQHDVEEGNEINGAREDNFLIFEKFVSPQRSTFEEF